MKSPAANRPPASAAFVEAFRARAGVSGMLRFDAFMELALYHPQVGYYVRDRPRVGRSNGTDFYTSTSSGSLFGELVVAACIKLLAGDDPHTFTFVEIGAEPSGGILKNVAHPFSAAKCIRVGESLELSGRLVVFSNELFDAQPLRRFAFRGGVWRELGVHLDAAGNLTEIEINPAREPGSGAGPPRDLPLERSLPATAPEGYHLDLPLSACSLAEKITAQTWSGLFVAFDYGKSWRELTEATPHGTARAYYQHTQSNDLLANPGEQDLTGHVCWDWLAGTLTAEGFASPAVESQESFFIHHAGEFIAATIAAEATRLSTRKLSLMQLLHPANMGQKFQVLHALRK
jgi:SAM-dependent MidA family methyltransferase